MGLYKRGCVWWMEFLHGGVRYRRSSGVSNRRQAEQIEAAFRTQIAKGEVGIEDRKPVPLLRSFAQQFTDHVTTRHAEKPQTVDFYIKKLKQLLQYEPLRESQLDRIDEALIERYVIWRRNAVGATTVNRELATLRKLLRLALEWKVIRAVPRVRLLGGERVREFVLNHADEKRYLEAAPEPLRGLAVLLLDTGMRLGEALKLQWPDIHFEPTGSATYGWLRVREGKSRNAKRVIPLTRRVQFVLSQRRKERSAIWVFAGELPDRPVLGTSLAHLHSKTCRPWLGKKRQYLFPAEFVLHSLRHTFLTRLGEAGADAFTIMKLAGHSSVTISQRYVHPTPESVERAFVRLEALNETAGKRLEAKLSTQKSPQHMKQSA